MCSSLSRYFTDKSFKMVDRNFFSNKKKINKINTVGRNFKKRKNE